MKRILAALIVGFVVLMGLGASAAPLNRSDLTSQWNHNTFAGALTGDELDQSMTDYDGAIPVGSTDLFGFFVNLSAAQSFTPQKEIQTRAYLFMARNATTIHPCYLAVRDDLTGEDLTSVAVEPAEFPVVTGMPTQEELAWVEFNFEDIRITQGETYYFVLYTVNITDNFYWVAGNGSDIYPNGTAFFSFDDGQTWEEIPDADACFQAYGRGNQAPAAPVIEGPTKGKPGVEYAYTFVADDPDGDDVYYWILWGDGCPAVEWIGPYASGDVVTVKHTFAEKGTYTISAKAKDVYDAESDWGTLTVSMPCSSAIPATHLWVRFLQRFPNAFPLVRYLIR